MKIPFRDILFREIHLFGPPDPRSASKFPRHLIFATAALAVMVSAYAFAYRNTALIPVPPREYAARWMAQHEANLATAKKGGVDILFLGDSITAGWTSDQGGRQVWAANFAPRHAANFGVGGDRIQNLLWRVENGELDGLDPKVIVLLIGTNNCGDERDGSSRNTTPQIIRGISNLIRKIQSRLPQTKIILFGIFPRDLDRSPYREQIKAVNAGLATLADDKVVFLDIGEKFLEPGGKVSNALSPDMLHPNAQGYQIWADAINHALDGMVK
jgi:lysophospholipase L1-like esterase